MCNVEGPPLRAQVPKMLPGGDPLPIYLDHNATTPVAPEAWEAMMDCQHIWGNPSSTHPYGLQSKYVIDNCREIIAKALDVPELYPYSVLADHGNNKGNMTVIVDEMREDREEDKKRMERGDLPIPVAASDPSPLTSPKTQPHIIFTSCGTESNNLAIFGTIYQQREIYGRNIILTSNVEHPATTEVLDSLLRTQRELYTTHPSNLHGTHVPHIHGSSKAEEKVVGSSSLSSDGNKGDTHHGKHHNSMFLFPPFEVIEVPVNPITGAIDVARFMEVYIPIASKVALVTVMHANNELGSVQPIGDIIEGIRRVELEARVLQPLVRGRTLIHIDAAQSIGKIPVSLKEIGVDLCSVVGHKFYGPKGVGALYCKTGVDLKRVSYGAGHEGGVRPGTENIILIAGMARALQIACENVVSNGRHMKACRDTLYDHLRRVVAEKRCVVQVNGSLEHCLPNTLNIAIYRPHQIVGSSAVSQASSLSPVTGTYISANRLLDEVGSKVAASAGSACHSTNGDAPITVSKPLQAIHATIERAMGTLRLSTGKMNNVEEMKRAARIIGRAAVQQFEDW